MSDRVDRGWLAPGRDLRSTHKVSLRFGGRSQFEEFHALCGAVADIGRLCRCGPAAVRSLSAEIEFQRFLNCPLDDADITTIVGLSILDSFGEFIGPLSERPRYPVRCPGAFELCSRAESVPYFPREHRHVCSPDRRLPCCRQRVGMLPLTWRKRPRSARLPR